MQRGLHGTPCLSELARRGDRLVPVESDQADASGSRLGPPAAEQLVGAWQVPADSWRLAFSCSAQHHEDPPAAACSPLPIVAAAAGAAGLPKKCIMRFL